MLSTVDFLQERALFKAGHPDLYNQGVSVLKV